jgi:hypothetical protein
MQFPRPVTTPGMPDEQMTSITFRAPQSLRMLILAASSLEDRTASNWIRRIISKAAPESIRENASEGKGDALIAALLRADSPDDVTRILAEMGESTYDDGLQDDD